jgi:archaellum component FlaC
MFADRNILRKMKTELEKAMRPFNQKVRRLQNEIRMLSAQVSRLSNDILDLKKKDKD